MDHEFGEFDQVKKMLIKNADVGDRVADIRISDVIESIGQDLAVVGDEEIFDAQGLQVIPGLHDHHIHFFASLAREYSLECGPPFVGDLSDLASRLRNFSTPNGWIRGFGYHESVAGDIDRHTIDWILDDRPVRIQHRSGKMWILNTCACELLQIDKHLHLDGIEKNKDGLPTGRLFRLDGWLREQVEEENRTLIKPFSEKLLSMGITGFTDASYTNSSDTLANFKELQFSNEIAQKVTLMGDESLEAGFLKVMLDEDNLPELGELQRRTKYAHEQGRGVAFHCVSQVELLYALEALRDSPNRSLDRIEHASLVSPDYFEMIRDLEVLIVTQPGFIWSKGEQYLRDVDVRDQIDLYRYHSLLENNIPVLASSDSPYGPVSPWKIIRTAADRKTREGQIVGAEEAVSRSTAIDGYLTQPGELKEPKRSVQPGDPADLCVLKKGFSLERDSLIEDPVVHTIVNGELLYSASSRKIS